MFPNPSILLIADLKKVEQKIVNKRYTKLAQFIGDMTKIFDNCRYYNDRRSPFYSCAESLEAFFVGKIKEFRDNMAWSRTTFDTMMMTMSSGATLCFC